VVLLSKRQPRFDGMDLIKQIRDSEEFHDLPVIVFAASKSECDQFEAYGRLANVYVVKPMDFESLSEAIRSVKSFWHLAQIPENTDDTT
jgi:DNA-binding response OmpR family regulator